MVVPSSVHPTRMVKERRHRGLRMWSEKKKQEARADGAKMARKERGRNEMPRAIGKFRGHAKMIRPRRSVCAKVRRR